MTDANGKPYQIETQNAEGKSRRCTLDVPALAGLPVDQELGNLEGKELRFGTSAGPTWAALTRASRAAR